MNLVYFLIHEYYPYFIRDEDIIQTGMYGLCRAANSWDESKALFSTYASRCILYEINNEVKRRKRHSGMLSLDYPVYGKEGEVDSFGDLIAGDADVDYVNIQPFYEQLKPKEQAVFDLLLVDIPKGEIATRLGVSRATVSTYIRRLRKLWRNYFGD